MKVTYFKDKRGEWRWRLCAANGRIVADSGEGYTRRASAKKSFTRMLAEIIQRSVVEVE